MDDVRLAASSFARTDQMLLSSNENSTFREKSRARSYRLRFEERCT